MHCYGKVAVASGKQTAPRPQHPDPSSLPAVQGQCSWLFSSCCCHHHISLWTGHFPLAQVCFCLYSFSADVISSTVGDLFLSLRVIECVLIWSISSFFPFWAHSSLAFPPNCWLWRSGCPLLNPVVISRPYTVSTYHQHWVLFFTTWLGYSCSWVFFTLLTQLCWFCFISTPGLSADYLPPIPRAWCMSGKLSVTELHPNPIFFLFFICFGSPRIISIFKI